MPCGTVLVDPSLHIKNCRSRLGIEAVHKNETASSLNALISKVGICVTRRFCMLTSSSFTTFSGRENYSGMIASRDSILFCAANPAALQSDTAQEELQQGRPCQQVPR